MWGISPKKQFGSDNTYLDESGTLYTNSSFCAKLILFAVVGFATHYGSSPGMFLNGASYNSGQFKFDNFHIKEGEVDMLLDVDKKTLDICVVGKKKEQNWMKIYNIKQQNGWIPHFNIHENNIELRIAKIPPSLFGEYKKDIFAQI